MKKQNQRGLSEVTAQRALLAALSDDLSLPFLQIKTGVELLAADDFAQEAARIQSGHINSSVQAGLKLIEAYRFLLKSDELINLNLEPVAIGAILEEVAHQLSPLAQDYSTRIEVDVQGRLAPVLAHQPSLSSALQVLATSLIRAQAAQTEQKEYRLVLGAHRSLDGLVAAGVFSETKGLSDLSLRAARSLVGQARQPLSSVPPGAASGILVADMLCASLWQPLRAAAHRSLGGLATGLPISKQLEFTL